MCWMNYDFMSSMNTCRTLCIQLMAFLEIELLIEYTEKMLTDH
jgi:hypothetical protein